MSSQNVQGQTESRVAVRDLSTISGHSFDLAPGATDRAALSGRLGLLGLRKLRFFGTIAPDGDGDWRLEARLGASAVQRCVVTAEPVTTRIDCAVRRRFVVADAPDPVPESEFDGDTEREPLGDVIDLWHILGESLALELPDYPRKPGAVFGGSVATPAGVAPLAEDDVKPFAALAALRGKPSGGTGEC